MGSREEELPIGRTQTFGGDVLGTRILLTFWDAIAERVPRRCVHRLEVELDDWLKHAEEYIEHNAGLFNKNAIGRNVKSDFDALTKQLFGSGGQLEQVVKEELISAAGVHASVKQILEQTEPAR